MYQEFYKFREKPFNLTPDPRFIYLSQKHREAIAHLLYGINSHVGFMSLTGEVGSGKTTVLRCLLSYLESNDYKTALILNPSLSPAGLLRSICREFGVAVDDEQGDQDGNDVLEKLSEFLLHENSEGRTVVLIIDEAQNLSADVLEQVRLISNLETDSDKLIQIILAGQPELLDMLRNRNLRQLSQRITVRYHLTPLDLQDTEDYINHRIDIAQGRVIFSHRAVARIYKYSKGLPRLINAACDRALMAAYAEEAREISGQMAAGAVRDLVKQERGSLLQRPIFLSLLIFGGIVLIAVPLLLYATFTSNIGAGSQKAKVRGTVTAAPVKPSPAFKVKLQQMSRDESLRLAFNAIANLWKAKPAEGNEVNPDSIEDALESRGLNLLQFTGTLTGLKVIDCPAILELALPGAAEKRYVALTGYKTGKIMLGLPTASDVSPNESELIQCWTGRAYIPWKNFLELPEKLTPGGYGDDVEKLQKLMADIGIYKNSQTGVYGAKTENAIKVFQSMHGLEPDGAITLPTLLAMYRANERFEFPALNRPQ